MRHCSLHNITVIITHVHLAMKRFSFSLSKHAEPVNSPKFAPCEPYSLIHHEHDFRLHLVVNFTVCTRSSITFSASPPPPPSLSPVCSYLKPPSGIMPQKYIMFCTSPCVLIVVCPSREKRYVAKLTERTPIMHCACSVDDAMCRPPHLGIVTLHSCIDAELQFWLAGRGSVLELSGVTCPQAKVGGCSTC